MPADGFEMYLGDGAYVRWDGADLEVYTFNGISKTNIVIMEPAVLRKFEEFVAHLRARKVMR